MHSRTSTRSYGVPPPLPVERRAEPRTTSRLPALVQVDGRSTETVLRDVSVSGAFVECDAVRAEGQHVGLRLHVPTSFGPIEVGAEVRWILRGPGGHVVGAGVRFDSMRAREMRAWASYVRSLT